METRESLKKVERRAYRATFEDGFHEILWGGLFLLFAWIPFLESLGIPRFVGYPFILPLAAIPWLGKRYITTPRLGAVEFGEKRKSRNRVTALIGVAAVVLMLPVVFLMFAPGFPEGLGWRTVALMAAPMLVIGIYLTDYPRMFIYFILFIYSILATEILQDYVGIPLSTLVAFGIPGAMILAYGFIALFKFLKKYPRPAMEALDVSR